MKKNKGFTLIELLATIIILAGIAIIAFPTLLNAIKNSENKIDSATKKLVISAASLYIDNNLDEYPKEEGNTYCIPFSKLIEDKHLEKGILEAADVDASNKTVKVTVTDSYDYSIVNSDKCTNTVKVCKYQGTDESKKYEYGAEYECELGDGVTRTFYLLEDGDNTELTNDTGREAQTGQVSLIVDTNLRNGDFGDWSSYLIEQADSWSNLTSLNGTVTIPSAYQVAQASSLEGFDVSSNSMDFSYSVPDWLKLNLNSEDMENGTYGYWCYEMHIHNGEPLYPIIVAEGALRTISTAEKKYGGFRPVITITKDAL